MTTENSEHNQNQMPPQPAPANLPPPAISAVREVSSDLNSLKTFFSLTGGSILYCLSALAIIYGISQTFGTLLTQSKSLSEAIGCFAALNIYELAMLGILITIVVWRNVTDDAISLVVLVALFLIASGTVLGTIAYHAPDTCLLIGVGAVTAGLGKLYAMRRFISLKLGNLAFLGMGLVLLWNFLTSSLMSKSLVDHSATDAGRRIQWLIAWLVLLAGGVSILAAAVKTNVTSAQRKDAPPAFLYTPSMTWIFALVLLAAAYAHQYAIAYMFVVDHAFGDYIPLIAVLSLLLVELAAGKGKPDSTLAIIVTSVPLALAFIALMNNAMIVPFRFGFELLWYAPVMLGLIGIGILWLSFRHRMAELRYVAAAYAMCVLLTADFVPRDMGTLHWHLTGAVFVAILLVLGMVHKNISLCMFSVMAVAIGFSSWKPFQDFLHAADVTPQGAFVGIIGLGVLLICLFFRRKTPKLLVIFGAISTSFFAFDLLWGRTGWQISVSTAGIAILCVLLWLRNRSIAAIVLLCIPPLVKFYMMGKQMSHWRWIILSFLLLFLGALTSLYKGKKTCKNSEESAPLEKT